MLALTSMGGSEAAAALWSVGSTPARCANVASTRKNITETTWKIRCETQRHAEAYTSRRCA